MPDRIGKVQRWLDLLSFLAGRRVPAAVDEIMEQVPAYERQWGTGDETDRASARRKFERDKDELRDLGIPLETVSYTIDFGEETHGYRLSGRDFYLPYLKLIGEAGADVETTVRGVPEVEIAEGDAGAALDALRRVRDLPAFPLAREARSAFRKLAFDLDADALAGGPLGEAPVLYVDRPGAEAIRATLRTLNDALLARKRVRFRYHGIYRDATTERDVALYGLLFQQGHWYAVGHDALRDGVRVFRVGRMEDVEPNARSAKTPDYTVPGEFDIEDYLDREAWELGEAEDRLRAEVLFRFPASLWAERNGYGELVDERADGAAVRRFEVHQVGPFLRWVLGRNGDAEIQSPPELRAELQALASEVAGVHGGRSDAAEGHGEA